GVGRRLRRAWVRDLLADRLAQRDMRPALPATMPRLPISAEDADIIAAALVPSEDLAVPQAGTAGAPELWRRQQCGRCHRFGGAPVPVDVRLPISGQAPDGIALAPDLAHTRERFQPGTLVRFLLDPNALSPDTLMPRSPLTDAEARSLAAYIL